MKRYLIGLFGLLLAGNVLAHGMSEADKQRILDAGLMEYIELGASHMLTGYDHLLFLFGVVFFLTRFNDIIKFVTAFTIGHSITHPATTTHGRLTAEQKADAGISDGLVRISVGLEDVEDIKADLARGLSQ